MNAMQDGHLRVCNGFLLVQRTRHENPHGLIVIEHDAESEVLSGILMQMAPDVVSSTYALGDIIYFDECLTIDAMMLVHSENVLAYRTIE